MPNYPVDLTIEHPQCKHAIKLLNDPRASSFFTSLQAEFSELKPEAAIANAKNMVAFILHHIEENPDQGGSDISYAIYRVLNEFTEQALPPEFRPVAEKAACALYCIAAFKWVNLNSYKKNVRDYEKCEFITSIPAPSHYKAPGATADEIETDLLVNIKVICAVISASIYGGKIEFVPTTNATLPLEPAHHYPIKMDDAGDDIAASLETAFFKAIVGNSKESPIIACAAKQLESHEKIRLKKRLEFLKNADRINPTLIILDHTEHPATFVKFADYYCIPVMFPTITETANLLGVDPDTFAAHFDQLWRALSHNKAQPLQPAPTKATGADDMTTSTGNISLNNIQGPVSITTATSSTITQSTTSTSSHIRHNDADLQALTELFNNIRLAITTLPHHNDDNKKDLSSQVDQVEAEVKKQGTANKETIKNSLKYIETAAKFMKGGEQLLEAGKVLGTKINEMIGSILP